MPVLVQGNQVLEMPRLPPDISNLSDERFFQFCAVNRKLRIERTAEGKIIIMSPAGGEAGRLASLGRESVFANPLSD